MEQKHVTRWMRFGIVLLVLFASTTGFLLYSILGSEKEMRNLEADISKALDDTIHGRSIEYLLTTHEKEAMQLRSQFVTRGAEVLFIEYIEKSAEETDVILTVKSVSETKAAKASDSNDVSKLNAIERSDHLSIAVRAEGDWDNVIKFASFIEYASLGVYIKDAVYTFLPSELDDTGETIPARWSVTIVFGVLIK